MRLPRSSSSCGGTCTGTPSWPSRRRRPPSGRPQLLADAGISVNRLPGTGLVADIGPGDAAYRVALRADMDALPVDRAHQPVLTRPRCAASPTPAGTTSTWRPAWAPGWPWPLHRAALTEAGVGRPADLPAGRGGHPGRAPSRSATPRWLDDVDEIFALHCDPSLDIGQIGLRVGALTSAASTGSPCAWPARAGTRRAPS